MGCCFGIEWGQFPNTSGHDLQCTRATWQPGRGTLWALGGGQCCLRFTDEGLRNQEGRDLSGYTELKEEEPEYSGVPSLGVISLEPLGPPKLLVRGMVWSCPFQGPGL